MVSSDLLDVVLGVVFAWFVLSLVCSALGESFNWLTRVRSKLLWRSLSQLFDSGINAADARLRTAVIKRQPEDHKDRKDLRPTPKPEKPGSWYGKLFKKLFNTKPAATPHETQALYELIRRRVPEPAPGSLRTRISAVPTEVIGDAFESLAAQTVTKTSLLKRTDDSEMQRAIQALQGDAFTEKPVMEPASLQTAFDALWSAADTRKVTLEDLEALLGSNQALLERVRFAVGTATGSAIALKARAEVERWFDGAMDGLSAYFRRNNRKKLAIIAFPVVVFSNSALFGLVDRLQNDRDLRTAVAASASEWATAELLDTETGSIDLEAACKRVVDVDTASTTTSVPPASTTVPETTTAPSTTSPPTTEPGATTTTTDPDAIEEARRRYRCATLLLESSELIGPLGLTQLTDEVSGASKDQDFWTDVGAWIWPEFIGRVLTWAALLFGAAFWYDVLKRIVGLKGKLASTGTTGAPGGG